MVHNQFLPDFFSAEAAQAQVKLTHPDSPDLAFVYGTIVTDGGDHTFDVNAADDQNVTTNICIFADKEVRFNLIE